MYDAFLDGRCYAVCTSPTHTLSHSSTPTHRLTRGVGWRATAEEREETAEETAEGYTEGGHLSKARWEVC